MSKVYRTHVLIFNTDIQNTSTGENVINWEFFFKSENKTETILPFVINFV